MTVCVLHDSDTGLEGIVDSGEGANEGTLSGPMVIGGNGIGNSGGGGPPPGKTPGLGMFRSLIPFDPGGQNQQRGQGPNTGLPSGSRVLDKTEAEKNETSGGSSVKVGIVMVGGSIDGLRNDEGVCVIVPTRVCPAEIVPVVRITVALVWKTESDVCVENIVGEAVAIIGKSNSAEVVKTIELFALQDELPKPVCTSEADIVDTVARNDVEAVAEDQNTLEPEVGNIGAKDAMAVPVESVTFAGRMVPFMLQDWLPNCLGSRARPESCSRIRAGVEGRA